MPRTLSDATRFTATGPYASSHPSTATASPSASSTSQINFGSPAPRNETPQQKIARLRAAAAAAKRGKDNQFDRVVLVGRRWADRAHRVTTVSLIGLTVISAAVAVAGISDMIIHNRRRRNEWLAEQQARTAKALAEAKDANAAGALLNEDQRLLLNRERVHLEVAETRRNQPGFFKRALARISGEPQNRSNDVVAELGAHTQGMMDSEAVSSLDKSARVQNSADVHFDSDARSGRSIVDPGSLSGGTLDRQAQFLVDSIGGSFSSWSRQWSRSSSGS